MLESLVPFSCFESGKVCASPMSASIRSVAALVPSLILLFCASIVFAAPEAAPLGYYRFPALHGDVVVFTAEGDLWRVGVQGGLAQRLTSHPSEETNAAISPDGKWVAFSASYEGPTEVYVMPLDGGVPTRCTYEGEYAIVVGWTPDSKILYATGKHSTLPDDRLCLVDWRTHARIAVPLSQASDGCYDGGDNLFFTRLAFQGSQTKRYQGGTAQKIWKWEKNAVEATPLTGDFAGTSRSPMWWNGRVYFASDRDGVMNVWSMNPAGKDLRQHTHHTDYDIQSPSLDAGRVVYQRGADLYLLDLATGKDALIPIRLASDYDQMRERWMKKPMDWVTSSHLSPDGKRVALTARGQVFVAPTRQGRLMELTRKKSVRYRDARFLPDGKSVVVLSDESGEVELWKLAARGDGDAAPEQLTRDATILRWTTDPSPDGKWIAHTDKSHRLYLYDMAAKTSKRIAASDIDDIGDLTWSPDSRYLAFTQTPPNTFTQIKLYAVETGTTTAVTTDRYSSYNPAFSPDGRFLYFLSDRRFRSLVGSPWGSRQPEPFFDKQTQVFYVALRSALRSPFLPDDELNDEKEAAEKKAKDEEQKAKEEKKDKPEEKAGDKKPGAKKPVIIDTGGLAARIGVVPVPPGNYGGLTVNDKRLFFHSAATDSEGTAALVSVEIKNENVKTDTVLDGVRGYELSQDGKKILATKGDALYVFDAGGVPSNLGEMKVNLDGWAFSFDVREEWRQMFTEAWRLHRDYLYATNMQGVDWPAMREKYRPLVDRVTDRSELSDVLAQMVGEVSLLHTFVYGGDQRSGMDSVGVASLGAEWAPDAVAGGCRLTRLYRSDPDEPDGIGPLLRPDINLKEGDVIALINGVPASSVADADSLLRAQSGKQVRLRVYPGGDRAKVRDVIVTPVSSGRAWDLRYDDWEYSRRLDTQKMSGGALGYVHLRAMGSGDIAQWQRDFYPVFDRQGLIVDVRHNGGGNIDSWILEKLQRKAWMYWNHREDSPTWNMQYAFRGPVVVLCDERTASDGEAFAEGFRRLGLGKVIGTRTWGGEVWLSGSNTLVDRGVATAAEFGVYGPEGKWLIEGHGVEPDIVVDNLPRATFDGKDAQLEAAVKYLLADIKNRPVVVPKVPPFPDRSFHPKVPRQPGK
jgi:tricorn protease